MICYAFTEISKDTWEQIMSSGGDMPDSDDVNAIFKEKIADGSFSFRLLATFILKDGLRPTAASAVQYARESAGLRVRLVSNDHVETARSVARKAGILTAEEEHNDACIMLGEQFDQAVGGIE